MATGALRKARLKAGLLVQSVSQPVHGGVGVDEAIRIYKQEKDHTRPLESERDNSDQV